MVIKASSARHVDALVADLGSDEAVRREAAVARLMVLGPRAVERLLELLDSNASTPARIAALRILEAGADPRALGPALDALTDANEGVARAAVAISRTFLRGSRGASVVDRLTGLALDSARPESVRLAAIGALMDLEPSTVGPLLTALQRDPSDAVRAAATPAKAAHPWGHRHALPESLEDPFGELERAATEDMSADPVHLRQAIAMAAATAPISTLLRLVERARQRESANVLNAAEWMAVRGAAHVALAGRGSRVAVYDLRESLESAALERNGGPPSVEFLAALSMVGDRSCLEAIAAAWERTADDWWRQHLADTFRGIVEREHITKRHAILKKIERKLPGVLRAIG